MQIFKILSLFFGLIIVFRTFKDLNFKNIISKSGISPTKIAAITSLTVFFSSLIAKTSAIVWSSIILITPVLILATLHLWSSYTSKKVRERIELLVALTLLKIRSGKGFQASVVEIIDWFPKDYLTHRLKKIIQSERNINEIEIKGDLHYLVKRFLNAGHSGHLVLQQLQILKRDMNISGDFRRKSGRALAQARSQLFIILFLYLAIMFWHIFRNHFEVQWGLVAASTAWFSIGVAIQWQLGRKINWKI